MSHQSPRLLHLVVFFLAATIAFAVQAGAQQGESSEGQVRWPLDLAKRVAIIDHAFPVIDRVVIVPDVETYLDELERWSPRGRWPVLFDDLESVSRFVRAFEPSVVYRRASVRGAIPFSDQPVAERQARLERIIASAFAGDEFTSPSEAFASRQFTPAGLVMTTVDDPAWTAAVALAAGRGQWLSWFERGYRSPNGTLPNDLLESLHREVRNRVSECGVPWEELGDGLETITLCRSMAGKAKVPDDDDDRAITDLVGRHPDGRRYAFTGLIFGDEVRCTAMAMASLFLDFDSATMLNTYPSGGGWDSYEMLTASQDLRSIDMDVTHFGADVNDAARWVGRLGAGWNADMIWVNSRGRPDDFRLADDTAATAADVPILNTPAAIHMIHSWSMNAPEADGSIGGTWLERGACAVVGSVHEPMLQAFIPPRVLATRVKLGVPYLVAARHWVGAGARPWKINTIGDPLMQVRPLGRPDRLPDDAVPSSPASQDLWQSAVELLRAARESKDPETCRDAVEALVMIGRDKIAADFWRWTNEQECGIAAAMPALGAIFRRADAALFVQAYDACGVRDEPYRTMLWHLLEPRLHSGTSEDELLLLQNSVRGPRVARDLGVLLPHLRRAFGSAYADGVLLRAINDTERADVRKQLQNLQRGGPVSRVDNAVDAAVAVLRVNRRPEAAQHQWRTEVPPPVASHEPTRCTR